LVYVAGALAVVVVFGASVFPPVGFVAAFVVVVVLEVVAVVFFSSPYFTAFTGSFFVSSCLPSACFALNFVIKV